MRRLISSSVSLFALCVALGLAGDFGPLGPARAEAQGTRYGVVVLSNDTANVVNIQYHWGDADWASYRLDPNHYVILSWEYDFPNENRSPQIDVRFDCDLGPGYLLKQYELAPYACATKSYYKGHQYSFRRSSDGNLDLHTVD